MTSLEMFESIGYKQSLNIPSMVKYRRQQGDGEVFISVYLPTMTVSKGDEKIWRSRLYSDFSFDEIQAVAMLIGELRNKDDCKS